MLARPPGYYVLASVTEEGRANFTPEVRRFIEERYPSASPPDFLEELAPETRTQAETEVLATLAYRMGRIDGTEAGHQLRVEPFGPAVLRRLLDLCHRLVPRQGEHLHRYQAVVRHYVHGLWQGASLVLAPTIRGDSAEQDAHAKARRIARADLEVELEAATMRFVPIWEYRSVEHVPNTHVETMIVRAERVALLRDRADTYAREHVADQLAAIVGESNKSAVANAYLNLRAKLAEQLESTADPIEENRLQRLLQTPVLYGDVLSRIHDRNVRYAPPLAAGRSLR